MSDRITIVLDADNEKKLREIQAREIRKLNKSVSFSRVLNDVVRGKLK